VQQECATISLTNKNGGALSTFRVVSRWELKIMQLTPAKSANRSYPLVRLM
jgi:hypothetical protein